MEMIRQEAFKIISIFVIFFSLPLHTETNQPRVVSLVPSVTEIIYAIDGEDALVGIVDPEGYPTEIDKIIVGRYSSPNFEKIYSLSPDIVFVEGGEQERFINPIESLGIKAIKINPEDVEGIFSAILEIGEIIGKTKEASVLVESLQNELCEIRKMDRTPVDRQTAFLELSQSPLITVGKKSFLNNILEEAGVINITADIESAYPVVSQELVVNRNPDVIILAHKEGTDPRKRIGWSNIKAVKNGKIIKDIDLDLLLRPGPRVIQGIRALISAIYKDT